MTTKEIAEKLVTMCRTGNFQELYQELFSPDIVNIEPEGTPNHITKGLAALQQKGKEWDEMITEVHSSSVSDPVVGDSYFACQMRLEATFKGSPEVTILDELCVYEVRDGKIVKEQFFYDPAPAFA
ncbi:MAG: nuclear transport factor 2 family protein [Cyclobacteriaceae bacterium]